MIVTRKIFLGYAGQLYGAIIGLLMLSVLIRKLGAETYGLVGLFAALQGWFSLLDAGMFQMVSREAARFSGGAVSAGRLWAVLTKVEFGAMMLAVVGYLGLFCLAPLIVSHWLQVEQLPLETVVRSLWLMGAAIVLRWLTGLYRQLLLGLNRQEWVAIFTISSSTARFVLVFPILLWFGNDPQVYFGWQLFVSCFELAAIWFCCRRTLSPLHIGEEPIDWWALVKFSLGVASASLIWIATTQMDKLLLSRLLPLSTYGISSVVGLLAGGVLFVVTPVGNVSLPVLTRLAAAGDQAGFTRTYRLVSQSIAVIAGAVAAPMIVCADDVLNVWTGSAEAAHSFGTALAFYAAGGLLSAASSPGYYLQYAKGSLRWHSLGNGAALIILTAGLFVLVPRLGLLGAAVVWAAVNFLYYALWMAFLHRRFLSGIHLRWLGTDTALPAGVALVAAWSSAQLPWSGSALWLVIKVVVAGLAALVASSAAAPQVRAALIQTVQHIMTPNRITEGRRT